MLFPEGSSVRGGEGGGGGGRRGEEKLSGDGTSVV